MKRHPTRLFPDKKWLIMPSFLILTLLFFLYLTLTHNASLSDHPSLPQFTLSDSSSDAGKLPRFAYMIAGTKGDVSQLKRLLQAVYHPRNYYLLHLDADASDFERIELAKYVRSEAIMRNVMVIGKPDLVTYKGPTMIACTLHAVAVLLKKAKDWDWFINLGASDYPLMSQDDMLHIFSYLPRDLNFLEHTSTIGWKENQRARPIIIDPGLYHSKKSGVFFAKEKRSMPASFKLFMGIILLSALLYLTNAPFKHVSLPL